MKNCVLRYLRSQLKRAEENEHGDEETSGATSGEEIWGTPTSGGEMEDPLTSPHSDGGNLSVSIYLTFVTT